jgi:hypothetical protein
MNEYGALVEKLEHLEKKPVSVPLFPLQIPLNLVWDQIQATVIRGQQLAA